MCLKIVAQLSGHNKYSIDKLVHFKVPSLCLMEDFTDVVDWILMVWTPTVGPEPSNS
jgi:hypothetical protein